jgi:hypothetical protein
MRYFPIILLMLITACDYPDIEIGQYDVELARTFIWEQQRVNPNGKIKHVVDTITIAPTCLFCEAMDSTESLQYISNLPNRDTVFIDTVWTWTYTVPK